MKLHILSDLHLEFAHFQPEIADVDVVILAGDTNTSTRGVKWAQAIYGFNPSLVVEV